MLTIRLAPFVPCSTSLLVSAILTPIFFGEGALPVAVALASANIALLALTGLVPGRNVFRGEHVLFIMEVPPYHAPSGATIARFVWSWTLFGIMLHPLIAIVMAMMVYRGYE